MPGHIPGPCQTGRINPTLGTIVIFAGAEPHAFISGHLRHGQIDLNAAGTPPIF